MAVVSVVVVVVVKVIDGVCGRFQLTPAHVGPTHSPAIMRAAATKFKFPATFRGYFAGVVVVVEVAADLVVVVGVKVPPFSR